MTKALLIILLVVPLTSWAFLEKLPLELSFLEDSISQNEDIPFLISKCTYTSAKGKMKEATLTTCLLNHLLLASRNIDGSFHGAMKLVFTPKKGSDFERKTARVYWRPGKIFRNRYNQQHSPIRRFFEVARDFLPDLSLLKKEIANQDIYMYFKTPIKMKDLGLSEDLLMWLGKQGLEELDLIVINSDINFLKKEANCRKRFTTNKITMLNIESGKSINLDAQTDYQLFDAMEDDFYKGALGTVISYFFNAQNKPVCIEKIELKI